MSSVRRTNCVLNHLLDSSLPVAPSQCTLNPCVASGHPTVAFIGSGMMATALATGIIAANVTQKELMIGCDVTPKARFSNFSKPSSLLYLRALVFSKVDCL
jgi:hypothetical protein